MASTIIDAPATSTATSAWNQPDWLDRGAYPFQSHFLTLPEGRMHYVDEGGGENWPHEEQPHAVTAALSDFLQGDLSQSGSAAVDWTGAPGSQALELSRDLSMAR